MMKILPKYGAFNLVPSNVTKVLSFLILIIVLLTGCINEVDVGFEDDKLIHPRVEKAEVWFDSNKSQFISSERYLRTFGIEKLPHLEAILFLSWKRVDRSFLDQDSELLLKVGDNNIRIYE